MNVRFLKWNKPRKPTEKELKEQFAKEGLKPTMYVMDPREYVDVHEHTYDETRIIVSGEVEFAAEGKLFVMKPGDRLDIKAKTPHTAKTLSKEQCVMLCATKRSM